MKNFKTVEMLSKEQLFDKENGIVKFQEFVVNQCKIIKDDILPTPFFALGLQKFKDVFVKTDNMSLDKFLSPLTEKSKTRKASCLGPEASGKKPKTSDIVDIRSFFVKKEPAKKP